MTIRRGDGQGDSWQEKKGRRMRSDVTDTGHCICLLLEHQNRDSSFFPMAFPLLFNLCGHSLTCINSFLTSGARGSDAGPWLTCGGSEPRWARVGPWWAPRHRNGGPCLSAVRPSTATPWALPVDHPQCVPEPQCSHRNLQHSLSYAQLCGALIPHVPPSKCVPVWSSGYLHSASTQLSRDSPECS